MIEEMEGLNFAVLKAIGNAFMRPERIPRNTLHILRSINDLPLLAAWDCHGKSFKYPISVVTISHYTECPPSAMKDMYYNNNIPDSVPDSSCVVVEDWLFPFVEKLIKHLDDLFGFPDGGQIGGLNPGCILCLK